MISLKSLRRLPFAAFLLVILFTDSQAQRKPYPRLSLEVGMGYALFAPDEFNTFLAGLPREKIANGLSFRGGLRVQVSPHIDFNFKIGQVSGVSKANFFVTGELGPEPIAIIEDEYRARTLPVSIGVGGRLPLKKIKLRAEFNIEHHIARVQYKIPARAGLRLNEFQTTAKSNGLGFSFAAGPEWRPLALLALNAKVGYRAAKISDFLSVARDPQTALLPFEFAADFSGVFFEAGVQIHP